MWFHCDTYFMNMTITIESVLYRYAGTPRDELSADGEQRLKPKVVDDRTGNFISKSKISSLEDVVLDPEVHLIIAEDNATLNSGTFFVRSSDWSVDLMKQIWGNEKSPWIDHPWWENAALTWYLRHSDGRS